MPGDLARQLGEDGLLSGKVIEERAVGGVGSLGGLRHGRGVEAMREEELPGRLVDARAKLALLALPASLDGVRHR